MQTLSEAVKESKLDRKIGRDIVKCPAAVLCVSGNILKNISSHLFEIGEIGCLLKLRFFILDVRRLVTNTCDWKVFFLLMTYFFLLSTDILFCLTREGKKNLGKLGFRIDASGFDSLKATLRYNAMSTKFY